MARFELLGIEDDETRLLRAPDCGYSIALAGHPRLSASTGSRDHDVVITLDDLAVTHAFRLDELPLAGSSEPQSLAEASVAASLKARSSDLEVRVRPLPIRPLGTAGGACAIYPCRSAAERTTEHVWVMVHAATTRLLVLHHTTWFRNEDVNNLQWAHLRASFLDQHSWDATRPRDTSPVIWPRSDITLPSAKLGLTEQAWKAAAGKAADVGHLTTEQVLGLVALFREFSQSVLSPRTEVPELLINILRTRVIDHGPPHAAAILTSDLASCRTRHDLRGWAWQCTWALGNRAELDSSHQGEV